MISSDEGEDTINKSTVDQPTTPRFYDPNTEISALLEPSAIDMRIWIAPWEDQEGDR